MCDAKINSFHILPMLQLSPTSIYTYQSILPQSLHANSGTGHGRVW